MSELRANVFHVAKYILQKKGTMTTMNDIVSIKMTLTQAHLLASVLGTAAYDVKDIDKDESERLKKFEKMVKDQIAKLDYSENEKLVDETNAKIAKEADE